MNIINKNLAKLEDLQIFILCSNTLMKVCLVYKHYTLYFREDCNRMSVINISNTDYVYVVDKKCEYEPDMVEGEEEDFILKESDCAIMLDIYKKIYSFPEPGDLVVYGIGKWSNPSNFVYGLCIDENIYYTQEVFKDCVTGHIFNSVFKAFMQDKTEYNLRDRITADYEKVLQIGMAKQTDYLKLETGDIFVRNGRSYLYLWDNYWLKTLLYYSSIGIYQDSLFSDTNLITRNVNLKALTYMCHVELKEDIKRELMTAISYKV